jgi:hypothetical protein
MSEDIVPGRPPAGRKTDEDIAAGLPPAEFDDDGARCPSCGARRITAVEAACWMCQEPLPAIDPASLGSKPLPGDSHPTLVFLGILAVLVMVSMLAALPGAGILLIFAATPAFIRLAVLSGRRRAAGAPMTKPQMVATFLGSLGMVVTVGTATFIAFFAACFAVCVGLASMGQTQNSDVLLFASVGAGLAVGLAVCILLLTKAWSRKSHR